MLQNKKLWILVGTRPEVIKQAPVYISCCEKFGKDNVALVGTGQHRELLEQALKAFDLTLDCNLEVMKEGASLSSTSALILKEMDALIQKNRPRALVVQGDTSSAAMAALAAFHNKVPVAHNEAGLRSYDIFHPFPEETNRRIIAACASLHLAPTQDAYDALIREGIEKQSILLTGNTGIDSLFFTLNKPSPSSVDSLQSEILKMNCKPVLMTAHRRENEQARVDEWFQALARFLDGHKDIALIYPMHPNKMAQQAIEKHLKGHPRVRLLDAIDYPMTCHLLSKCRFVITDSGGIQEEAATLGLPVVVCREKTERMEAVKQQLSRLAGTQVDRVLEAMEWAYTKSADQNGQPKRCNVFGDGKAASRISEALSSHLLSN